MINYNETFLYYDKNCLLNLVAKHPIGPEDVKIF